ncbi:MAG: SMP-30/gluconolactonase/LRE family protein, partial [Planctomycetota bacterium]
MRKIQKFQISLLTVMIISLIYPLCGMSQESTNPSTIGKIEILDDGMNELISPDAEIELLATGFEWSEGPLWVHDKKDGYLIFSDI